MPLPLTTTSAAGLTQSLSKVPERPPAAADGSHEAAMGEFVGSVFFGQMLKALRSTQGETAYLGGGQGEKVFRQQFDQMLVDQLSQTHGPRLAGSLDTSA